MTQNKILVTVFLAVLMLFGWMQLLTGGGDKGMYDERMASAADLMDRQLYQRAGQEYVLAAQEMDTDEAWDAAVEAYKAEYAREPEVYDEYLQVLTQALASRPGSGAYARALAALYTEKGNAREAYNALSTARKNGASGEELEQALQKARYACTEGWQTFASFSALSNGFYAVDRFGGLDYISADGDTENLRGYTMLGPVGEDGVRLVCRNESWQLETADAVVQGYVNGPVEAAGVYAQGLIPLCTGGSWNYHDILGDVRFGGYEMAGSFVSGKAAVRTAGGWQLIDDEGQPVSGTLYNDICLDGTGRYLVKGVMLADAGQGYQLFDKKEKLVSDFSAEEVDMVTEDGLFAFRQADKWGFANTKGEEVIPAQYEEAKSFSNGLAAVQMDGKWGFINTDGLLVIDCQYEDADYFNEAGCCMVLRADEEWRLLQRAIDE